MVHVPLAEPLLFASTCPGQIRSPSSKVCRRRGRPHHDRRPDGTCLTSCCGSHCPCQCPEVRSLSVGWAHRASGGGSRRCRRGRRPYHTSCPLCGSSTAHVHGRRRPAVPPRVRIGSRGSKRTATAREATALGARARVRGLHGVHGAHSRANARARIRARASVCARSPAPLPTHRSRSDSLRGAPSRAAAADPLWSSARLAWPPPCP